MAALRARDPPATASDQATLSAYALGAATGARLDVDGRAVARFPADARAAQSLGRGRVARHRHGVRNTANRVATIDPGDHPAGNFGAVPVRTSSTGSDGTASKAEAKARAAAEELARLKLAAEKRASQQRRRRARRTRSAKAT